MIDASLNEVETVAAKAARGAGLSWGLADDTGKAARWLAVRGIDWADSLVRLLKCNDALAAPIVETGGALRARNPGQLLSPILTGAYIADTAPPVLHVAAIATPLWLLPFAARCAQFNVAAVTLSWPGAAVMLSAAGNMTADGDALLALSATSVVLRVLTGDQTAVDAAAIVRPRLDRSAVAAEAWTELAMLGARTYVPASAQSRDRGAGAGLTDND